MTSFLQSGRWCWVPLNMGLSLTLTALSKFSIIQSTSRCSLLLVGLSPYSASSGLASQQHRLKCLHSKQQVLREGQFRNPFCRTCVLCPLGQKPRQCCCREAARSCSKASLLSHFQATFDRQQRYQSWSPCQSDISDFWLTQHTRQCLGTRLVQVIPINQLFLSPGLSGTSSALSSCGQWNQES